MRSCAQDASRWRQEDREAIEEFNAYIKKYGIFGEEYWSF